MAINIRIEPDWILLKLGLILASILLILASPDFWIWLGLPALVYFAYEVMHEFIHAFAIWWYNGQINTIYLGYPRSYIDFRTLSLKADMRVWEVGAYADIASGSIITGLLVYGSIATTCILWAVLAFCMFWLFISKQLLPPLSDFQQYRKAKKQYHFTN